MVARLVVLMALVVTCLACNSSDSTVGGACSSRKTCGYTDHHYNSVFHCQAQVGYTWRDPQHCGQECTAASSWGCDASGCETGCATDTGPGTWLPCTEANDGVEQSGGCFLKSSGVNGELVSCECR
jgi:hypothetical protein